MGEESDCRSEGSEGVMAHKQQEMKTQLELGSGEPKKEVRVKLLRELIRVIKNMARMISR